jgi:hypothetical protein
MRSAPSGQAADSEYRIVFAEPVLLQAIGFAIGIVLSAVCLIGSIVLFLLPVSDIGAGE